MSQNARRHGLSGGFTILAHEDSAEFESLLDEYRAEFKPSSVHDRFLVEEIGGCDGRGNKPMLPPAPEDFDPDNLNPTIFGMPPRC